MKKNTLIFLVVMLLGFVSVFLIERSDNEPNIEALIEQHQSFLDNSPFKDTKNLSKSERKSLGLPPNGYNERMWELTMDPKTGRPMPERLLEIQEQLKNDGENMRGVGGDNNNPWVDRGPNDIGGRTRGIMFDPNDSGNVDPNDDYTKVFAGGVSGGLWVNNDITNANSSWTLVPGIGANISVNVIISDPNNTNTFYIGAGESYTSGAALGRGIWKSTDGGVNWTNIFGGYTGTSNGNQQIDGIFYVNDIVARDIGSGNTELYAAIAGAFFASSDTPSQFHSLSEQGLYKSVNNGTTWAKITTNLLDGGGTVPKNPNDLEIDFANNIWLTTTTNSWGYPGGEIFRSTNGTTFNLMTTIAGGERVELETSATAANTLWVAANVPGGTNQVDLFTTTDAFTTTNPMTSEPADVDTGIPNSDFTRGQAWYDLTIEADASGNLLVGGVDLFRTTDNATTWSQISKWSNNNNLAALMVSLVHADHHATVFRPGAGNSNKVVFGTDGGIFYCDDITTAASSTSAITARNKDYNTVQFYYGDISAAINGAADDLIGGTQDNGTPAVYDAAAGPNGFTDITGGDGGYTEIDDAASYIITAYPNNNHYVLVLPATFYQISSGTGGDFINTGGLDKNLDILYSNSSTTTPTYSIERNATFTGGVPGITRATLTDALLNASPTAFKVSPYTGGSSKLFVGLETGRLLRIDDADGGVAPTWNNIDLGGNLSGSISDIELGESESDIFVTMHNYGVTSVWFTNNGGTTWQNKEGDLPDMPVKCILQNPLINNEVIIGTELGVWATANYTQASPHWFQVYNGMSDVTVLDLDLRASDNVILATTHGRGMFTSQFTSTTLGLAENSLTNGIKVFPTVSNGEFSIISQNSLGNVDLEMFNLSGQRVYKSNFELSSTRRQFNLNLSSGIYLIKIKGDNFIETKKIVIR